MADDGHGRQELLPGCRLQNRRRYRCQRRGTAAARADGFLGPAWYERTFWTPRASCRRAAVPRRWGGQLLRHRLCRRRSATTRAASALRGGRGHARLDARSTASWCASTAGCSASTCRRAAAGAGWRRAASRTPPSTSTRSAGSSAACCSACARAWGWSASRSSAISTARPRQRPSKDWCSWTTRVARRSSSTWRRASPRRGRGHRRRRPRRSTIRCTRFRRRCSTRRARRWRTSSPTERPPKALAASSNSSCKRPSSGRRARRCCTLCGSR